MVDDVRRDQGGLVLEAAVACSFASCVRCATPSARVHSRYRRKLADASIGGRVVVVRLRVRRFFCTNDGCAAVTFAEQVAGLTVRWARRTTLLSRTLQQIGLALAGRAGSRMARRLGIVTSRDTLLRLVRAVPDPPMRTITVLGVDDFAVRRGRSYGTVIVDMGSHRPIDLLVGRTAETLAAWLGVHPGAEVVCRDRAGAYAEAIRVGAPAAIQVADRWHLWHNLVQAVGKTVTSERAALLHEPESFTPATTSIIDPDHVPPVDARLIARTRERHAAVHAHLAKGWSISAIGRALTLDRKTVRRFARAANPEEVLVKTRTRASLLDPYKPHLHQRLGEGTPTPRHCAPKSRPWATGAARKPCAYMSGGSASYCPCRGRGRFRRACAR
ncbi:ISL3 family transposase [Nocardia gipuzkoensis]